VKGDVLPINDPADCSEGADLVDYLYYFIVGELRHHQDKAVTVETVGVLIWGALGEGLGKVNEHLISAMDRVSVIDQAKVLDVDHENRLGGLVVDQQLQAIEKRCVVGDLCHHIEGQFMTLPDKIAVDQNEGSGEAYEVGALEGVEEEEGDEKEEEREGDAYQSEQGEMRPIENQANHPSEGDEGTKGEKDCQAKTALWLSTWSKGEKTVTCQKEEGVQKG